ncbi:hypothetical protein J0S82_003816 [Galemys pyrenaicus]|uniref:Uncharacterized protein n=1 Tax=Galemys pyrenaicus TaxID=202257 RepID=A0A8J6A763_GALPY|nr:hypothetical protein J0S82_003816 [Galemys pyrenaicus]
MGTIQKGIPRSVMVKLEGFTILASMQLAL